MADSVSGGRMTSLDAAFYYSSGPDSSCTWAASTRSRALDFDRLRADLTARLHLIPRYTERVVSVPLNLGHPTWEADPHFDIRHHVLRHVLRPPGDEAQLVHLASRLFAQPLHRGRPLWELHQIDGYLGDRSVIFAKVHHAMIDGVSGVQLLGVMFDTSPIRPPCRRPRPSSRAPLPSPSLQLMRAVREGVQGVVERAQALTEFVRSRAARSPS
jgi:WS/DGAT/MGAT family acyltransferase